MTSVIGDIQEIPTYMVAQHEHLAGSLAIQRLVDSHEGFNAVGVILRR